MDTYIIIIFIILLLIPFVLQKNNKRFIIYSITGLKKYFDKELNIHSYNQRKDLHNKLNNYATKNDIKFYTNDLKNNIKEDLKFYISKKVIENNTPQKLKALTSKNANDEKYKLLSKIVDTIIKDSKSKDDSDSINKLYDSYKPNWYK